jgi:NTE family protein
VHDQEIMMAVKKALVLSGGGARGAYHIGVIEALVAAGWMADGQGPDILAGTSIGAINAAALASGRTVAELRAAWMDMHTEDVHRLSTDLPPFVRPLVGFLMRSVLTSQAHGGASMIAAPERDQGVLARLGTLFRTRPFRSLLDTAPWRTTLGAWMDFAHINSAAAPALLIAATELQSGALQVFCNRALGTRPADTLQLEHLMASASIPIVYPWTEIGAGKYWDGAVLANTPLDPVLDLVGDDDPDILVVMMTPWHTGADCPQTPNERLPQDLVQALTLTLDWALLASYRMAFAALHQRNEFATFVEQMQQFGATNVPRAPKRIRLPTVIAPQEFMPLEWIIDYEEANHEYLFALGRADAERALRERAQSAEHETLAQVR